MIVVAQSEYEEDKFFCKALMASLLLSRKPNLVYDMGYGYPVHQYWEDFILGYENKRTVNRKTKNELRSHNFKNYAQGIENIRVCFLSVVYFYCSDWLDSHLNESMDI